MPRRGREPRSAATKARPRTDRAAPRKVGSPSRRRSRPRSIAGRRAAFAPAGHWPRRCVEADEPRRRRPAPRRRSPLAAAPRPRVLAKPPVRKLAKDLGVDLGHVTPTGPGRHDHPRATSRPPSPGVTSTRRASGQRHRRASRRRRRPGERETREPVKGVRKMMAGAMVQSAFTAPHVTEWVTVDVDPHDGARRAAQGATASSATSRSRRCWCWPGPLMLAMRRTPEINSFWDEAAQEIVFKHYVNLGIAAATPRGLVVPNIKDAQRPVAASTWPRRSASSPRPRARARPSRPT